MNRETSDLMHYDERAEFYDIDYQCNADHEFIRRLITPGVHRILEIPCGVGRNTFVIAESGRRVVAVDLEPAMVAHLKKRIANLEGVKNVSA
jgi:cyclopropane fatty-acyl-phospholipid synthase-like methyltransferase